MKNKTIIAAIIGGIFAVVAAVVSGLFAQQGEQERTKLNSIPTEVVRVDSSYVPSGWMGDAQEGETYIKFTRISEVVQENVQTVIKVTYRPGPKGWAGIYWLYPENNWGNEKGKNLSGAKRIEFFARGETGGEIVEFKSGGVRGTYGDTYQSSTGKISLSHAWERQEISLAELDLTNVVGLFSWNAAASDNGSSEITFYIANINIVN